MTHSEDSYDGNGNSFITFYGFNDTWLGQNYGIPAGTYKPEAQALGYIQQTQDLVSVTLVELQSISVIICIVGLVSTSQFTAWTGSSPG